MTPQRQWRAYPCIQLAVLPSQRLIANYKIRWDPQLAKEKSSKGDSLKTVCSEPSQIKELLQQYKGQLILEFD